MKNYILQYLLIFTPFLLHLVHDTRQINRGTSPKHGRNLAILIVFSLIVGYTMRYWTEPRVGILQYLFFAGTVHLAFFNYSLNFFRVPRKPFFYLGSGPFDEALKFVASRIGWLGLLFVQFFLLFAGFMFYHYPTGY